MNPMRCSSCGATAEATCHCGVAYIPAGEYAAKAVAANPGKSDRAIAAAIGVGSNTVRRARKATAPNGAVAKRLGKDGKARKLPTRSPMTAKQAQAQTAKFEAQRAKAEFQKARAEAVVRLFGAPISNVLRGQLVNALEMLPFNHPAERVRARLGMSWNQLIVAAAAEKRAA